MFSHLAGEDIPGITTDDVDDLMLGNDADLPPEARQCPIAVRRLMRNAHQNLDQPSNYARARLMKQRSDIQI